MFNIKLGDYKDDFLKAVGWDQEKNPEDLPFDLVPGSDAEEDLEDAFSQLSIFIEKPRSPDQEDQETSIVEVIPPEPSEDKKEEIMK